MPRFDPIGGKMQRRDPHPREVFEILARRGPETRIAVVGASTNPQKFGNRIVRDLAAKGYTVLPVNPKEAEIEGLTAYPSLAELDPPVSLIDVVTPPPVTKKVLEEVERLGLGPVWLQDGTFDDEVLEQVARAPFPVVYNACIMRETDR
jgi:hypothetical protein